MNENISIRISNIRTFLKEELFDVDAFYPEYQYLHLCRQHLPWLGYEVSQAFQAIISVLSRLTLCPIPVLSFLRRVPSNWMISSSFLVLIHFANDTCPPQRRPLTGTWLQGHAWGIEETGANSHPSQTTPNLPALSAVAPMHEETWELTADGYPCFQSHS